MADVQHLKNKGIPLRIDGCTRYVRGTTKYTTCADVIKMVLKKTGIEKEYRHLFAIYEVSKGGEKALPCKSKILKVLESWEGVAHKLVLRKNDTTSAESEAHVTIDNDQKSKKKCSKSSRSKSSHVAGVSGDDEYMKTLVSLTNFVTKSRSNVEEEARHNDSDTSSDSSMDEFLSKLDKSKLTSIVKFFSAMANNRSKSSQTQHASRRYVSETDESSENSPVKFRERQLITKRASKHSRRSRRHRLIKKSDAGDIHPNKIHKIERVNFGFIDVEPSTRDLVYTRAQVNVDSESRCVKESVDQRLKPRRTRPFPSSRRRLILGKRNSYQLKSPDSSCKNGLRKSLSASTSEDEYDMSGMFRAIGSTERMCANTNINSQPCAKVPVLSTDAACSALSPDSMYDATFVVNRPYQQPTSTSVHRLPETSLYRDNNRDNTSPSDAYTSTEHRLVNYSLTEDDFTDSEDSALGSASSKTSITSSTCSQGVFYDNMAKSQHLADSAVSISGTGSGMSHNDALNSMADEEHVSEYIKSVFSKSCVVSEDEEMDSFMKSINNGQDDSLSEHEHSS